VSNTLKIKNTGDNMKKIMIALMLAILIVATACTTVGDAKKTATVPVKLNIVDSEGQTLTNWVAQGMNEKKVIVSASSSNPIFAFKRGEKVRIKVTVDEDGETYIKNFYTASKGKYVAKRAETITLVMPMLP